MNIIFVCTGNTCRSPMAEGYLKSLGFNSLTVCSRGFMADGDKVSENSISVMREIDIDISAHTSKALTAEDIKNADKIICLAQNHLISLISIGVAHEKLCLLGEGISDPYGGDISLYRRTRDQITDNIDTLICEGFFTDTHIKSGELADADDIALIENAAFTHPWSKKSIEESMNAGTKFFIAVNKNSAVGYMGLSAIAGEGYVTNVAVLEGYRNKGVGKQLLIAAAQWAKKMSLEFISLEVRASNKAATSLYEKMGFERVGIRKRFYDAPQEDAIIMTRRFTKE